MIEGPAGLCKSLLLAALTSAAASATTPPDGALRDYPFVVAAYTDLSEADFDAPVTTSTAEAREYRLALGIWRFEPGVTAIDVGLDYQYTRYEYEGITGRNRDLHRLQLPFGLVQTIGKWQLDGYFAPGVSTSSNVLKDLFDEGSGDDVIVTARLEGARPTAARWSWLAGLAYDRSFGEPEVYPVGGVLLSPRYDLALRIAFPDPRLSYAASERQRWSLRLFPAGHEWHVWSEELSDDFDYGAEAWRVQGTWSWRFWGQLWLDLSAGYEFARHHSFRDDLGMRIDADLDDQFLLSVGLRFTDAPLPITHVVSR